MVRAVALGRPGQDVEKDEAVRATLVKIVSAS